MRRTLQVLDAAEKRSAVVRVAIKPSPPGARHQPQGHVPGPGRGEMRPGHATNLWGWITSILALIVLSLIAWVETTSRLLPPICSGCGYRIGESRSRPIRLRSGRTRRGASG